MKMVEIRYGENQELAELTGKTIAEVREQYKQEFGIPDRAKAKLNGKGIGKKLESVTDLYDEDELCFEEKSRKGLVMLGAFLLTLAITGGLFAYTATTSTGTITVTVGGGNYGDVSANSTPDYSIQGRRLGSIPAATLFNVTVPTGAGAYTGDMEVQVYLSNPEKLSNNYSSWLLRLGLTDNTTASKVDVDAITQVLSIQNPVVSFAVESANLTPGAVVYCYGGSYRAFPFSWLSDSSDYDPVLFAQVVQREQ
jgi:hypothetical protein